MAGPDLLELAVGQADAPQSVMLDVVADLHGEDDAEAEHDVDEDRRPAAHPVDQRIPESGLEAVAPERIAVVPERQAAARQSLAGHPPGAQQVARKLAGEVAPDALALGRGAHVEWRADQGVVDVNVLGGVVRVRGRGEQELAEAALPRRAAMDQLVADDEDRLSLPRQHHRHPARLPRSTGGRR